MSRAWRDVEVLLSEAARPPGSDSAERTRAYLAEQLERAGLRTEEIIHTAALAQSADVEPHAPAPLTSLLATSASDTEGEEPAKLVLFVAPYTTRSAASEGEAPGSAEAGGSGAAVLLELARALTSRPIVPEGYGQAFLFVSGDGDPADPMAGSRSVATLLGARGARGERNLLSRVRAGFFVDRVCASDLRIVRDLYSSRNYREVVWRAARELGHGTVFAGSGFDAPAAGHHAFQAAGVHQMVGVLGSAGGVGDSLETCSSASLAAVGAVILRAAGVVESRLAQIDRFAAAPAAVTVSDERELRAASWSPPEPAAAEVEASPRDVPEGSEGAAQSAQAATSDTPEGSDENDEPDAQQDERSEDSPGDAVVDEEN